MKRGLTLLLLSICDQMQGCQMLGHSHHILLLEPGVYPADIPGRWRWHWVHLLQWGPPRVPLDQSLLWNKQKQKKKQANQIKIHQSKLKVLPMLFCLNNINKLCVIHIFVLKFILWSFNWRYKIINWQDSAFEIKFTMKWGGKTKNNPLLPTFVILGHRFLTYK